ncbi:hypothetical protein PY650_14805 [Rhizobium calliandrae]|uniref:Uncharacterized protein n=1 Tax=Rhizobium calliandrae TaxID=1312182 RepID=A0ABT7KFE0_9HYPH|nr:hypothetical protein [Rhizobium calliandrae]MDL2406907.1 hypothetical protein [Rhizobium calliandrae]
MQERDTVRTEIPAHVVDRLESEWRLVQVERSPFKAVPEIDPADEIVPTPADER